MYETGSGLKPYLPKGETSYPEEGIPTLQPFPPHVSKTCSLLSFAISSPLPCFHNFPSCLHLVCKNFPLPFCFFSYSFATGSFFCCIKEWVIKKLNVMYLTRSITIHFGHFRNIHTLFACNFCLLECCFFVRQSLVVRAKRCCCFDKFWRRFVLCFMLMKH